MSLQKIRDFIFGKDKTIDVLADKILADRIATTLAEIVDTKKAYYGGVVLRLQAIEKDAQSDIAEMEIQLLEMKSLLLYFLEEKMDRDTLIEKLKVEKKGIFELKRFHMDFDEYIDEVAEKREGDNIKYDL